MNPPRGGREHAILPNSPKNCMKLKEFGRRGGGVRPSRPPLDPPLNVISFPLMDILTVTPTDSTPVN